MQRLLFVVLALAAACSETARVPVAPLDRFYRPTGIAAHGGRLLVASSNSDLLFDFDEGGSVLSVAPAADATTATFVSGVRIPSFAGGLAVADAATCGTRPDGQPRLASTLALVPVRGDDALFALDVGADGALSCGAGCEVPLSGAFGDPNAVAVACGGGRARAFVGYLRGVDAVAWVTAVDLEELLAARAGSPSGAPLVESGALGVGPVRGMAYDAERDRLWVTGAASSSPTPLRAIELAGGCSLSRELREGGCPIRSVGASVIPSGYELTGIALSNPGGENAPGERRVYLTARKYDAELAAAAGGSTNDERGALIVADLVEGPAGVELRLARAPIDLGLGAAAVAVLPPRAGLRDVVVALASDSGELVIFDDDTGGQRLFGPDVAPGGTGARPLGHVPWALAVQPVSADEALVYVASFEESFVTAIRVPLLAPETAAFAGGSPRPIGPRVTP